MHRVKIEITGAVQGVGFRPFIYRLAAEKNLKGWVINSNQGVFIDAEGSEPDINDFLARIKSDKPANSIIQSFNYSLLEPKGYTNFEIRESKEAGTRTTLVLPDIATCSDCLNEIFDPSNRRYFYPFTNCTNCGPRFSIILSLPYDRINTTMGEFKMCDECYAEYTNPLDRRFHAEPTACPKCGPQVKLINKEVIQIAVQHEAVKETAKHILEGKIVALKGIGGYQLLADARNSNAIIELRKRKRRSEKPFALMFPNIKSVKDSCELASEEEILLKSTQAPIVLLRRRDNTFDKISKEAAINNPYLGVMLPYSPLHHILMHELQIPIVATSGNISEEPICINETEAIEKLNDIADYYLVHDRKIVRHVDDSIARISAGEKMILRRARGYAPLPVKVDRLKKDVLATGAHLKNTISVSNGTNIFISQHIGDLENAESINAFKKVIEDFKSFYEISPMHVVSDLHPDYISTKLAKDNYTEVISVQHHFAHILSCMAEHNIDEPVLGFSWDGTGYGTDGTIWGSECMQVINGSYKRIAHLKPFQLPGGERAIHEIKRTGLSILFEIFGYKVLDMNELDLIKNSKHDELKILLQMIEKKNNSPETSAMGRLFDGIASVIGIRQNCSFEAQGAMELEFAADGNEISDCYKFHLTEEVDIKIIDWIPIIKGILNDLTDSVSLKNISAKFHNTLAEIILQIATMTRMKKIILSGGCFQNKILLEKSVAKLRQNGFEVFWNRNIPINDGGISLGQIFYSTYLK